MTAQQPSEVKKNKTDEYLYQELIGGIEEYCC